MPKKDSTGKVLPVLRDLERMEIDELIWENMRLGDLDEYATPEIRNLRIRINQVRDEKIRERNAHIRRMEEAGLFPPGQVVKIGAQQQVPNLGE